MDAASTVRIPRNIINGADTRDPNSTATFPQVSPPDEVPAQAWPQNDYGQASDNQAPPPPNHGQKNPQGWAQLGTQQFPPPR